MGQQPKVSTEIRDFPGLVNSIDPDDLDTGAATVQLNATCIRPGELTVRQGWKELTFEA